MSVYSYVPDALGCRLIIPFIKDKSDDINSVSNYIGITDTCYFLNRIKSNLFAISEVHNITIH